MRTTLATLLVLATITTVSASLGITLPNETETVTLPHSESTSIALPLSPPSNSVCQLNCDYQLQLNEQVREADFFSANASTTTTIQPISVRAPPRTPQYGVDGKRTYDFVVSCTEAPRCGDRQQTVSTTVNVAYNLTDARWNRYEELTQRITNTTDRVDQFNQSIQTMNNTITSLPRNVAIDTVRTSLSDTTDEVRRFDKTLSRAQEEYEQLSYQFGLDILDDATIASLDEINDSLTTIHTQLDEVQQRHNNTAANINAIGDDLHDLLEATQIIGLKDDTETTYNEYTSLVDIFANGGFEAYQTLEERIAEVNESIKDLAQATSEQAQNITEEARTIIDNELETTCANTTCNVSEPSLTGGIVNRVERACSFLTEDLPEQYEAINDDRKTRYDRQQSQVNETNQVIKAYNDARQPANTIIKAANNISQNTYIDINATPCRTAVNKANNAGADQAHIDNVEDACEQVRQRANDAANTPTSVWTQITYYLSDIYTSYELDLPALEAKQQVSPPAQPNALQVTNTTEAFIDDTCSWGQSVQTTPSVQELS